MASIKSIRRYIIWGVIALIIFGLHWIGVLDGIYDRTRAILSPVTGYLFSQQLEEEALDPISSDELQALNDQIQNLLVENSRLKTKLEDIKDLKVELNFLENTQLDGTPAKIIGNTTDNFAKLFIINKGTSDGIKQGQAVIAEEGYLVGIIDSASENTSFIRPINDSQIAIAAKVQNSTMSPGIVKGKHGLSVQMELIPQTEEIQIEQRVVTSELNDNVPPDLLIGVIDQIESQEGELFQTATISALYSESSLRVVTILSL